MSYLYSLSQASDSAGQINWVFIHGWGSDNRLWQGLREALASGIDSRFSGNHFGVDLPGFGQHQNSCSSLENYLESVASDLPNRCILVGWSLGGMIATQLAHRCSKVEGLITLGCNPSFVARPNWPEAMASDTFSQFRQGFVDQPNKTWGRFCGLQAKGDADSKSLIKHLKQQTPPNDDSKAAWLQGLDWLDAIDNRDLLADLSVPSLHILGKNDGLVPSTVAEKIGQFIHADVITMSDVGHCLHLSQAKDVSTHITAWLGNVLQSHKKQIDKSKIAHSFGSAAKTYDSAAKIQKIIADELVDFGSPLSGLVQNQNHILDLGCGTGFVVQSLESNILLQTACSVTLLDLAESMIQQARKKLNNEYTYVVADGESLPFKDNHFNLVVSSLAVQWCSNLTHLSGEIYRALKPGGSFLMATLAKNTLSELKQSWQQVNGYTHVNSFKSVEEIQSEVQSSGLQLERVKHCPKVVEYSSLLPMLKGLKAIGAHNMNDGQNPGLTSVSQLKFLESEYEKFRHSDGYLPVTYDVVLMLLTKPKGAE